MFRKILIGLGAIMFGVWVFNTSLFGGPPEEGATRLLAHRGVHQTFDKTELGLQDCTATRIYEPTQDFLENTIPSMQAAFEVGADVVEIDIHWTSDGHLAVFHDWGAGCRTEASGKIETFTRAELKALDIGYGYTTDGGQTFPFRGRFVGAMPMLDEVFAEFPNQRFLINLKSNSTKDGESFAAFMRAHPEWKENVYGFYGGPRGVAGAQSAFVDVNGFSTSSTKACLVDYVKWGWAGHVPEACRATQILIPHNYARFLWGWPHKFTARMKAAGTDVHLAGAYDGRRAGSGGINTPEEAVSIPTGFDGYICTDKIEEIGPYLAERN